MKALDCGELETRSVLNQEMTLPRPGDTGQGSHYKLYATSLLYIPTIHDVLITLGEDTTYKRDWTKEHFMIGAFKSFDFVLSAHLLFVILGYTNELFQHLQRREHDNIHAIQLASVEKNTMQHLMRTNGRKKFLEKVTLFCNKRGVEVLAMEGNCVPYGR